MNLSQIFFVIIFILQTVLKMNSQNNELLQNNGSSERVNIKDLKTDEGRRKLAINAEFRKLHSSNFITDTQISIQQQNIDEGKPLSKSGSTSSNIPVETSNIGDSKERQDSAPRGDQNRALLESRSTGRPQPRVVLSPTQTASENRGNRFRINSPQGSHGAADTLEGDVVEGQESQFNAFKTKGSVPGLPNQGLAMYVGMGESFKDYGNSATNILNQQQNVGKPKHLSPNNKSVSMGLGQAEELILGSSTIRTQHPGQKNNGKKTTTEQSNQSLDAAKIRRDQAIGKNAFDNFQKHRVKEESLLSGTNNVTIDDIIQSSLGVDQQAEITQQQNFNYGLGGTESSQTEASPQKSLNSYCNPVISAVGVIPARLETRELAIGTSDIRSEHDVDSANVEVEKPLQVSQFTTENEQLAAPSKVQSILTNATPSKPINRRVPNIKNLEFGGLIQEETESKENTERTKLDNANSSLINTTINPPKFVYHYGKMINEADKRYFRYERNSPTKIMQNLSPRDRKLKQKYVNKRLSESLSFGIKPSNEHNNQQTEYTMEHGESEASQSIIVMIQKRNYMQDVKTQNQIYLDKSRIFQDNDYNAKMFKKNNCEKSPRDRLKQQKKELMNQQKNRNAQQSRLSKQLVSYNPQVQIQQSLAHSSNISIHTPNRSQSQLHKSEVRLSALQRRMTTALENSHQYSGEDHRSKPLVKPYSPMDNSANFSQLLKQGTFTQNIAMSGHGDYSSTQKSESFQPNFGNKRRNTTYLNVTENSQQKQRGGRFTPFSQHGHFGATAEKFHRHPGSMDETNGNFKILPVQTAASGEHNLLDEDANFRRHRLSKLEHKSHQRVTQQYKLFTRNDKRFNQNPLRTENIEQIPQKLSKVLKNKGDKFHQTYTDMSQIMRQQNISVFSSRPGSRTQDSAFDLASSRRNCVSQLRQSQQNPITKAQDIIISPLQQINHLKNLQKMKMVDYKNQKILFANKTQAFKQKSYGFSDEDQDETPQQSSRFCVTPSAAEASTNGTARGARKNYKHLDPQQKQRILSEFLNEAPNALGSAMVPSGSGLDTTYDLSKIETARQNRHAMSYDYTPRQQNQSPWCLNKSIMSSTNMNSRSHIQVEDGKLKPRDLEVVQRYNQNKPELTQRQIQNSGVQVQRGGYQHPTYTQRDVAQLDSYRSNESSMLFSSQQQKAHQAQQSRLSDIVQTLHQAKRDLKDRLINQKREQINQILIQNPSLLKIQNNKTDTLSKSAHKLSTRDLRNKKSTEQVQVSDRQTTLKSDTKQSIPLESFDDRPREVSEQDSFFDVPKIVKEKADKIDEEQRAIVAKDLGSHIHQDQPEEVRKQKLDEFMEYIDKCYQRRVEARRRSVASQKQFISDYQADKSFVISIINKRIKKLPLMIQNELWEEADSVENWEFYAKILTSQQKYEFQKLFDENDKIKELCDVDFNFKSQINKLHKTDTSRVLNEMIKAGNHRVPIDKRQPNHRQYEKGEYEFQKDDEFRSEDDRLSYADIDEKEGEKSSDSSGGPQFTQNIVEVAELSPANLSRFNKSLNPMRLQKLKAQLFPHLKKNSTILSKNNHCVLHDYEKEHGIPKLSKEQQQISEFVTVLNQIFPNDKMNMYFGLKYDFLDKNLYQNDFKVKMKKFLEGRGHIMKIKKLPSNIEDLDELLADQVDKNRFFREIKNAKNDEEKAIQAQMARKYYDDCRDNFQVPDPSFIRLRANTLTMMEQKIDDSHAKILKEYLIAVKNKPEKVVNTLILDDCQLTDHSFAIILEGIKAQGNNLRSLVYQNNTLGEESMEHLLDMIPLLQEIRLSSLKLDQNKDIMRELCSNFYRNGQSLMKLTLSKINLNDNKIVEDLCNIVSSKYQKFVHHLELSWCSLTPKHLARIVEEVRYCHENIRSLDLSYNSLYFNQNEGANSPLQQEDLDHSVAFVDLLCEYLDSQDMLNFLNISGMNFGREQIIKICDHIAKSKFLLSVHMNDNGIRFSDGAAKVTLDQREAPFVDQLKDIFGVPVTKPQHPALPPLTETTFSKNPSFSPEQSQLIRETVLKTTQCTEVANKKPEDPIEKMFSCLSPVAEKNQIIRNSQNKLISQQRMMNSTIQNAGMGRDRVINVDQFVVNRKYNFPELVYNQDPQIDEYFQLDQCEKWNISKKSECFVKDKHRYCLIFFRRPPDELMINDLDNRSPNHGGRGLMPKKSITMSPASNQVNRFSSVGSHGWKKIQTQHPQDYSDDCSSPSPTTKLYNKRNLRLQDSPSPIKNRDSMASLLTSHAYPTKIEFKEEDLKDNYNPGLIEIKDEESLKILKNQFTQRDIKSPCASPSPARKRGLSPGLTGSKNHRFNKQPYISGSVVTGGYSRKLKMMRADLFSLMCVSQSQDFISGEKQSKALKKGLLSMVESGCSKIEPEVCSIINDRIKGWNRLLTDKCDRNCTTDVYKVNKPDILDQRDTPPEGEIFVFACILPPGHHEVVIYDPVSERGYCKELSIDLNKMEYYPDQPACIFARLFATRQEDYIWKPQRTLRNVWSNWRHIGEDEETAFGDDDEKDEEVSTLRDLVFYSDKNYLFSRVEEALSITAQEKDHSKRPYQKFEQFGIKDIDACMEILRVNFHSIQVAYLSLQEKSPSHVYPYILRQNLEEHILKSLGQLDLSQERMNTVEIWRHVNGPYHERPKDTWLNRAEFMEAMIKYCSLLGPVKLCLQDFIRQIFYIPGRYVSEFVMKRAVHSNREINQMLIDNESWLSQIYKHIRNIAPKNTLMNLPVMIEFFKDFRDFKDDSGPGEVDEYGAEIVKINPNKDNELDWMQLHDDNIQHSFIYSKMVALSEHASTCPYEDLEYIEFLHLMCSMAMKCGQKKMLVKKHEKNTKLKLMSVISNTIKRGSAQSLKVLTQQQTVTPTSRQCAQVLHEFFDSLLQFYKESFVSKEAIVLPIREKQIDGAPQESPKKGKKGKKVKAPKPKKEKKSKKVAVDPNASVREQQIELAQLLNITEMMTYSSAGEDD